MKDVISRLSAGTHPVRIGGSTRTTEQLRERLLDVAHVLVLFTGTRGGTDLSFPVDAEGTDLSNVDFELARGVAHIEGTLTLDHVRVRCVADIDVASLEGSGRLVVCEES